MTQLPKIVVSTRDAERLEALLHGLPAGDRWAHLGLSEELARATVVEPGQVPPSVVTMNSVVRFTMPPTDKIHEARLCFPAEVGAGNDRLSVLTPVGTALLGLSEAQEIAWKGPAGKPITLRVEEVVFQPERSALV